MTSKQDILALADRVEKAEASEQAEMIADAWDVLGPIRKWESAEAARFADMLDAEAYESAAMMLVPEGLHWTAQTDKDGAHVSVGKADSDARGIFYTGCRQATAKSLGLALTAAALHAIAEAGG